MKSQLSAPVSIWLYVRVIFDALKPTEFRHAHGNALNHQTFSDGFGLCQLSRVSNNFA